jgi:hypothetical protein
MIKPLVLFLLLAVPAFARDPAVARAFEYQNPCPSTGLNHGRCPGWVRDHIIALCVGGPDTVANMQWQTIEEAKAKDRIECRHYRT